MTDGLTLESLPVLTASVSFPDQEFVAEGGTYYVDGDILVEYEWVDHGIGPYEAWGQRGTDVRMGVGEMRVTGLEDICRYDPDKDDVLPLTREEQDAIHDKLVVSVQETIDSDGKLRDSAVEQVHDAR